MTEKGAKIHALWICLTALYCVSGKMTRRKAERKAYRDIVEQYGEETLKREFEIPND